MKVFLIGFLCLVFLSLTQNRVFAITLTKGLEVNPAFTEVTLEKPNQEKTIQLTYTNHTDQPIVLNLSPRDFRQNENNDNYSFLNNSANYSYSLSSFLSLESDTLELLPQEKKRFNVLVKNREDISPGGHYAAIVARFTTEDNQKSNQVIPALTSLILLRKSGGEHFRLILQTSSFPSFPISVANPDNISVSFRNDGNIHLVPYGRVDITDIFGRLIKKGVLNEDSKIIYPESRRNILSRIQNTSLQLPISWNRVDIYGQDSLKKTHYKLSKSYLYINPFFLIALPILILIIYIFWKKHVQKHQ